MSDDAEWTVATGWRKAGVRLLTRGTVSMAIMFGALYVVVRVFREAMEMTGGSLPQFSWHFLGPLLGTAGVLGAILVSWMLSEHSGLAGLPLVLAAWAVLAAAYAAAYLLGPAVFGLLWQRVFIMVCSAACVTAVVGSAFIMWMES